MLFEPQGWKLPLAQERLDFMRDFYAFAATVRQPAASAWREWVAGRP